MRIFKRRQKEIPTVVEINVQPEKILSKQELIEYSKKFTPKQIQRFKIVLAFILLLVVINVYKQVKYAIVGRDQETQKQIEVLEKMEAMREKLQAEEDAFWSTIYNDSTITEYKKEIATTPEDSAKALLLDSCDCKNK